MKWNWKPGGRSEVSSFLVLSLLLLVLVSSFTLLAYWTSLQRLSEERQEEAAAWARTLAARIGTRGPLPRSGTLREWVPQAFAVSIFDPEGRLLVTSRMGDGLERIAAGESFSPQAVNGQAKLVQSGQLHTVQVDLMAATLLARSAALKIWVPVVLVVDFGVLFLLLLYAPRLLQPMDRILDRAKELGAVPDPEDEMAFLVQAFDNAVEHLARPDDLELKALEKALGSSLESGVLLCDIGCSVLALNAMGAGILGVDGDPAGKPVDEILRAYPDLLKKLDPALKRREPVQREECVISTPSGEKILGLTAHPLRRDDGEVRGLLILFADLTEIQKQLADEQLGESLQQLGELTAGIAHEMRNGLATIKGYLALIRRGGAEESIDDYVQEIRTETEALHRMLEEFLTFARPGGNRTESVDLTALIHRAAADPALGGTHVQIEVELGSQVDAVVRGDAMLLAKALANLLHNAWQAQSELGLDEPLLLRLSRCDGDYAIQVLDRGPGVPPQIADSIFDPFVTGRVEGVGLGLALTRRIALLHQGSVQLKARRSQGTCAELLLPAGKSVTKSVKN